MASGKDPLPPKAPEEPKAVATTDLAGHRAGLWGKKRKSSDYLHQEESKPGSWLHRALRSDAKPFRCQQNSPRSLVWGRCPKPTAWGCSGWGWGDPRLPHRAAHRAHIFFFLFLSLFFLFFNQSGIKARARTETSALSPPPRFSSAVRANERRPLYFFFFK